MKTCPRCGMDFEVGYIVDGSELCVDCIQAVTVVEGASMTDRRDEIGDEINLRGTVIVVNELCKRLDAQLDAVACQAERITKLEDKVNRSTGEMPDETMCVDGRNDLIKFFREAADMLEAQ